MCPYIEDDEVLSVETDSLKDICHYGVGHDKGGHSGRYPWGSGEDSFQRPDDFYAFVRNRETKGLSETEIARGLNMSTTELRAYKAAAYHFRRKDMVDKVKKLKEDNENITNTEIGEILGKEYNNGKPINESTIRSLLHPEREANTNAAFKTAEFLMKQVDEKGVIDVGKIVNKELGVSDSKLNEALIIAQANGYEVLLGSVQQQANPNQRTPLRVLAPKGTPKSAVYDYKNVHHITEYHSDDNGKSFRKHEDPVSMDSKRVMIRYAEEGGKQKDGVIEIRRGVKDLSLGSSHYAQVRILVDNDHYLKGMAVYSDGKDMPDGVDIIFNTNKSLGTPKMKVLKSTADNLAKDPENPFGATIKEGGQSYYDDPQGKFTDPITGNKQSLSLINKVREEGEWSEWSKDIPSQFLSKQPVEMISKQLNKSVIDKQKDYDEIMKVTNPTVRAKLLDDFANDVDAVSVELKAATIPGTRYHVILPSKTLKDDEVFAPNFPDGTQLALVRFPHGGTFEIPIVTVNNRNKECLETIGNQSTDAIGINSTVAARLSGADFDGDTVITIPTNQAGIKVRSTAELEGLKGFDTGSYGPDPDGIKVDSEGNKHYFRNGVEYSHINEDYKQIQMGIVSNLITDMTLQGATPNELARAVRHSMVIIDSYKHHLDYKSSALDNDVKDLHEKYQKSSKGGASTLISLAGNTATINQRAPGKYILDQAGNKDNGNELFLANPYDRIFIDRKTGKTYTDKDKRTINIDTNTGEKLYRETGDAYTKVTYIDSAGEKRQSPAYLNIDGVYRRPRVDVSDKEIMFTYKDKNLYYRNESGEFVKVTSKEEVNVVKTTMKVEKMKLVDDANKLSSGTVQERYYADYANKLKDMANKARLNYLYDSSHPIPYSPEARLQYESEVKSLEQKVAKAELNAPKERAANLLAAAIVKEKIEASDTELTPDDIQKLRNNELVKARLRYGAHNMRFEVTEKEWEAIQKGAVSNNRLKSILRYADQDVIRKLATPREEIKISESDIMRIKGLSERGETNAAIAKRLGISVSTVAKYLGGNGNE